MPAEHMFALILDKTPKPSPRLAGITLGGGALKFATVARSGPTLLEVLHNTVIDLEACGLRVLRVVDDDLITLAEAADRLDCSREAVRRYATGERGPGGFPPPANPIHPGATFYHWVEVADWMRTAMKAKVDAYPRAVELSYANLLLQARNRRGTAGGDPLGALIREGLPG